MSCHCLCAINHPDNQGICTEEATSTLRFSNFPVDSPLSEHDYVDVQVCRPCGLVTFAYYEQKRREQMADEHTLLVGEANVGDGMIMTQRGWAAEVLSSVGWATDHGAYPQEISAFDLGRALGRALTNSNESEHLMLLGVEILRGMQHYKNVKEYHPKEVKNG